MIQQVEEIDEGWRIKTFLDHRVEEGVYFIVDFQDESLGQKIEGKFEVTKVKHNVSAKSGDHSTEFEILTKLKEKEKAQEIKINGTRKPGRPKGSGRRRRRRNSSSKK